MHSGHGLGWEKHSRSPQPPPLPESNSIPKVPWASGAKGNCSGQGPGELAPPCWHIQGNKGLPSCTELVWRWKVFMQVSKEITLMLLPWKLLLPSIVHHPLTESWGRGVCWWRRKQEELDLSQDEENSNGFPKDFSGVCEQNLQSPKEMN